MKNKEEIQHLIRILMYYQHANLQNTQNEGALEALYWVMEDGMKYDRLIEGLKEAHEIDTNKL